jgi:F-type H+-transporting ATPase subunit epsilon
MQTLSFELVSPEKVLVKEHVEMVVIPGEKGDMGILPHHAAVITTLRPGVVQTYAGGEVIERVFVSGGFANINERGCTVLSEECIFLQDINEADLDDFIKNTHDELTIVRDHDEKEDLHRQLQMAMVKRSLYKKLLR